MTKSRAKSFTVYLAKNLSPDLEKSLIAVIQMMRGVAGIEPEFVDVDPDDNGEPDSERVRYENAPADDPLLSAAEAAKERGQGLSTFWRDVKAGHVPPAYYVGPRSPRWRRSELRAALESCRRVRPKIS